MQIMCNSCKNLITADNLDLQGKIALCTNCNHIFDFSHQLEGAAASKREEVALPKGIVMNRDPIHLEIIRRWYGPMSVILTVLCFMWYAMFILNYGEGILEGNIFSITMGSSFAFIGLIIVYYTVAGYINSTHIRADRDFLIIKHKPLPWFGNKSIPSRELDQLYSKKSVYRYRGEDHYSCEIRAKMKTNQDIKLLSKLPDPHQALFIEQEIERFLNIEDRPVEGEMNREFQEV